MLTGQTGSDPVSKAVLHDRRYFAGVDRFPASQPFQRYQKLTILTAIHLQNGLDSGCLLTVSLERQADIVLLRRIYCKCNRGTTPSTVAPERRRTWVLQDILVMFWIGMENAWLRCESITPSAEMVALALPWFRGRVPPSYSTGTAKSVFFVPAASAGSSISDKQRNTGQRFIKKLPHPYCRLLDEISTVPFLRVCLWVSVAKAFHSGDSAAVFGS